MSDASILAKVTEYKVAEVKWNGGYGALLCNGCGNVVKTGFDHPDVANYCADTCRPKPAPVTVDNSDDWGAFYG